MVFPINVIFFIRLVQYNGYLISTVDADDLVLWHQGIGIYSEEYTPMCL